MTGTRTAAAAVAIAALAWAAPAPAQNTGLTGIARLVPVYDAILDARLDEVPALLTSACGTQTPGREGQAPREACAVLDAVASWWRIRLDTNDTSTDQVFSAQVERAIAAGDAWTTREPRRAEAWFYLGAGYAARSQWRSLRGESLAAARDGKRIKEALEQATRLDPGLQDARFGIGLYQYYADVVPGALKMLRWLLLLPGGDRVAGLRTMEEARTGARLVRGEADYQLHLVYLWYEHAPERALDLVRALRTRHPRNPHFAAVEADIHDVHRSDPVAAFETWRSLAMPRQRTASKWRRWRWRRPGWAWPSSSIGSATPTTRSTNCAGSSGPRRAVRWAS